MGPGNVPWAGPGELAAWIRGRKGRGRQRRRSRADRKGKLGAHLAALGLVGAFLSFSCRVGWRLVMRSATRRPGHMGRVR